MTRIPKADSPGALAVADGTHTNPVLPVLCHRKRAPCSTKGVAALKKELSERQSERPRSNGSEAPPRPAVVIKVTTPPTHPMLADVQTALVLVNGFLTEPQYEPMRRALVTTALKELVVKIEGLIEQAQSI